MVMVSQALNPQACWEFEGEILVLHHPTTISSRYQAMGEYREKLNDLNVTVNDQRTGRTMILFV